MSNNSQGLFSKVFTSSPRQLASLIRNSKTNTTQKVTNYFSKPKDKSTLKQYLKTKYMIIFVIICFLILTLCYFIFNQLVKSAITNLYQQPLSGHLPHLKFYSTTFQEYLHKKNIHKLLQVKCTLNCLLSQKNIQQYKNSIDIFYVNHIYQNVHVNININDHINIENNNKNDGGINQYYMDWINFNQFTWLEFSQIQLVQLITHIKNRAKIGISIMFSIDQYYNKYTKTQISSLRNLFHKNGLYYNQIDSLTLRRIQGKIIQIFNSYNKNIQTSIQSQKNLIAIQTQINLQQDLSYLKQWIGYHISLGINKIFIYDLTQMYIRIGRNQVNCIGLNRDQQLIQWQKIWKNYQYNIIYIPWNINNNITIYTSPFLYFLSYIYIQTIQLNTQHDYLYYYKNQINYTIFIKSTQLIYSPIGMKFSNSIIHSLKQQQFNGFKLQMKYFVHRLCAYFNHQSQNTYTYNNDNFDQQQQQLQQQQRNKNKNKQKQEIQKYSENIRKYMLHNYLFYQPGINNIQYKYLFKTTDYQPNWGKPDGTIKNQHIHIFRNIQWRVNSYTLTKQTIKQFQKQVKYPNLYLSYDFNSENRIILSERMCQSGCFIDMVDTCLVDMKIECPQPMTKIYLDQFNNQL